jgi:glutaredoxin
MSTPSNGSSLVLVTGRGCHLCARAREVLGALGVTAREVDVQSAEAETLARRGISMMFLPVLTDGARVLAYGRFSPRALSRRLGP